MVSNFILNIPLAKLEKPIRSFRRIVNLKKYYAKTIKYIVLDIDDVHSQLDANKIIEYFKPYKVILGQSKSYNAIDNFRMKGILFIEELPIEHTKSLIAHIHSELHHLCTMDESVARLVSLNAPINKNAIFINNEEGELFKYTKPASYEAINEMKKEYVGDNVTINIKDIENITADTIDNLCLNVFQSLNFTAIRNNPNDSISFKHPSEKSSPGGYFWFSNAPYTMHHSDSTKTINIFDAVRKLPAGKELMKKEINYDDEILNFNTDTSVINVNEKYLEVNDELANTVEHFVNEKDGLLSIRSPMGTGKSTLIGHIINECHDQDMKILIITNRVSVAHDFGRKYDMKVYNKDMYNIDDSLICQFDSLWKYDIRKFDIVIMDEFISLMLHSRSNLNNSSINIAKFFACFNKKLVIADAFLTGYENFLLNNKKHNIHLISNNYRDPTTLYNYENFNYFVQTILYHVKSHKVTISATSLSFINSMQMLLNNKGIKVVTLTADTPETTKNLVYELFEQEEHDKWDVLIFSPTLTVGVSNLNKVNYHFHYDSSMSTDVISSIQMIKRTRKTKEIHMFIKDKINYIKTSYNNIRDEYMTNIGKNIEQNYLFDVDDYGEPKLSSIGRKAIKIDTFKNIMEFDHKKATLWLLQYHFLNEPRVIDKRFEGNVLSKYASITKENKDTLLNEQIEQFLDLNEIEKTSLLLDSPADKIMKALAEIDEEIKDVDNITKSKILQCTLKDRLFITKAKYYKVAFNYTKKIWDETDVKHLVSKSVIQGKNNDLHFYNILLEYGQNEIFYEYTKSTINKNKQLKYILDKCGYSSDKMNGSDIVSIGYRGYRVNPAIRELYGFIR